MKRPSSSGWIVPAALSTSFAVIIASCSAGASGPPPPVGVGDSARGRLAIEAYGCGACHVIPGIAGANALVGPPLIRWSRRSYIAGALPNNPDNLVAWIVNPQAVEPGTAMPNLEIPPLVASDIAAYLFTLE